MRKEMIIRVQTSSEKGASCKAIKVAAGIQGVESVTLAGEDRNLLLVIGVGVDSNRITKKLRQKVGHAEVVELRTVEDDLGLVVPADHAYRYHPSPSPYKHQQHHYYAGGSYPRDHYNPGPGTYKHQQHAGGSTYAPMAQGGRDYYYGGAGGGGGYYPAQYQQQQQLYQPAPANMHTVVHHEYANDPNSCSVM